MLSLGTHCTVRLMTKHVNQEQENNAHHTSCGGDRFRLIEDMELMLYTIFDDTTDGIESCGMKELTKTTLGMAKIKMLPQPGKRRGEGRRALT